jgi:hypothetical protein
LEDRRTEEGPGSSLRELEHQALDFVMMLLRYHRPGFDELPREERTKLVADACAHMNEFLEALQKLVTFLEHGRLNYRGPAAIKVASLYSRIVASCELRFSALLRS